MSKKRNKKPEFIQTSEEVVEPVVAETVEEVVEETIVVTGVVICERLNVREESSIYSNVVCVIERGTEVYIDTKATTEQFYKVCLASGVEGFCMRQFIDCKC